MAFSDEKGLGIQQEYQDQVAVRPATPATSQIRLRPSRSARGNLGSERTRGPRQRVSLAACVHCRSRKVKCDGERPCRRCESQGLSCDYTVDTNETQHAANKRSHRNLLQAHDNLANFCGLLTSEPDTHAAGLLRRLRAGDSIQSILRQPVEASTCIASLEDQTHRCLIMVLVQSTLSLRSINSLARTLLVDTPLIALPPRDIYKSMDDCVVTTDIIARTFGRHISESESHVQKDAGTKETRPSASRRRVTGQLTAAPWTQLLTNDIVFADLISLFLEVINPYWSLVDHDLFLIALRSGITTSLYCSRLLLHAVLSCASMFSQADEVFVTAGHYLTRGLMFHRKAMELWDLEHDRPSLTNLQALLVLSLDLNTRGKDRPGLTLLSSAVNMDKRLPLFLSQDHYTPEASQFARCRSRVTSTIMWQEMSCAMIFGRSQHLVDISEAEVSRYEASHVNAPSYMFSEEGHEVGFYSLQKDLQRQRSELTRTMCTINNHTSQNMTATTALAAVQEVHCTAERILRCNGAPRSGAKLESVSSAALFELRAQQSFILMTLYAKSLDTLKVPEPSTGDWRTDLLWKLRRSLRENLLKSCSRAARCLKEFREALGFKATTPLMWYQAAQLILVLLKDTALHPPPATPIFPQWHADPIGRNDLPVSVEGSLPDHSFAFEEGFRHLLGSGSQIPMPRGLARMLYLTAKELQIQLPDSIRSVIEIMAKDAWQTGDCWMFSSSYPNPALPARTSQNIPYTLEDCVRRWDEQTSG